MIVSNEMVVVTAPSNIALIKYMGKLEEGINQPTNSSVSFTLPALNTKVILKKTELGQDSLLPLNDGTHKLKISEKGSARFVKHLQHLKKQFGVNDFFVIQSGNNFPSDCGIASSASSFAALTKAFFLMLERDCNIILSDSDQAQWSSKGSGSSGRSFFSTFGLWKNDKFEGLNLTQVPLVHDAVLVSSSVKLVSSSEAHRAVGTSLLFSGRAERAEDRLQALVTAFAEGNWRRCYELAWCEFWDMHALFETSQPSFGYMTAGSMSVLNASRELWQSSGDGPIVTMDAGPNVHLIWRQDQLVLRSQFLAVIKGMGFHTISGTSEFTVSGGGN